MSSQLTLSQAAKLIKVSEKSIRRYIKANRLNATMVKGQKGEEYRINKNDLNKLIKPPRGKKSHRRNVKKTPPKKQGVISALQEEPIQQEDQLTPLKQIIEKNVPKIVSLSSQSQDNLIDYRLLYEKLLAKYEQSLIMIGSLEAQLSGITPGNNRRIRQLEESLEKQEKLILELYQMLRSYGNEEAL